MALEARASVGRLKRRRSGDEAEQALPRETPQANARFLKTQYELQTCLEQRVETATQESGSSGDQRKASHPTFRRGAVIA